MSRRLLGDLVTIALGFQRPAKDKQHRDVTSGVYEAGLFVFLNSFEANQCFPWGYRMEERFITLCDHNKTTVHNNT